MEKFKGTPGNWKVSKDTSKNKHGVTVFRIDSADEFIEGLAEVYEGFTIAEGLANAQLIATAPELLEALQAVCELFNGHMPKGHTGQSAIEQGYAAINKALTPPQTGV